jgi:hypothetical protein
MRTESRSETEGPLRELAGSSFAGVKTYLPLVFSLILLSCFLPRAKAQTAEILVNVTDSSGAVLVDVAVTIVNTDTGVSRAYKTDSAGLAAVPGLQPGPYKISALSGGFGQQERDLSITVGQVATVNIVLLPASSAQTIEVRSEAGLEIETSKSDVSGVVSRQQLNDLPVINRGFIGLAQLLPGGGPSLSGDARFGNQTSFGGSNVRSGYSTLIDGASMDHPIYGLAIVDVNQDAVQEFRVLHFQYDAEYSRAGSAVVDVVTRSGTNSYNGMFTYFGQDQALNARNYYATSQPPFSETHTSGTIGGPIIKDKTHFFFADEYLKQNNSFIEALPASNPFSSQFNGTYPGFTDEKTIQAKVDHTLNEKNNFFVRYLWEKQTIRSNYQLTDNYNIAFNDGLVQWEHIFSPAALNNAQLEYLDQNTLRYQTATGPEIIRPSFTSGTPPNLPQAYPRRRIGLNDTFYLTKGRHSMKMGTRMAYEDLHQRGNFYGAGVWTFNTNTAFSAGNSATYPTAYTVGSGASDKKYENAELGYFFQDDIKFTPRFTLNAGLRYDMETNLRDNKYLQQLFDDTTDYPGLGKYVTKSRGNYLRAFQPRLGIAYDLRGNGRTIIRAGYGGYAARNRPFFDTQMQSTDDNFTVQITNPKLLATYPSQTAVLGGLTLQQYVAMNGGRSLYLVGDNLKIPYIYELTLGVEKALFRNTVVTVDGIRQIQTGLQTGHDGNLPTIGPLSTHPRPQPQFGSVSIYNSVTSSYYSALQVQVKSQYKRAYTQLAYTWAKVISDGLDDNSAAVSDPFFVYGNNDRGLDEEDRRSALALTSLINLPFGIQASGIVSLLTGPPWNVTYGKDLDGDGNTQDRPAGLAKNAGGQRKGQFLNIINTARTSTTPTTLPSGFVVPALNAVNCAATNSCLQPVTVGQLTQSTGQEKIDLRLQKSFNFKERYHLDLFMEGYDILNTPSFLAPSGVISSPAFLIRATANNPRQLQWGARFTFKAK